MLELAVLLQALKMYAHKAHHVCARVVFNQDHEMLGEIYSRADSDYDDVVERFIGLHGSEALDEQQILEAAVKKTASCSVKTVKENKEMLKCTLDLIKEINAKIEVVAKTPKITQGSIQMVGDIANRNEVTIYKLQQRLK